MTPAAGAMGRAFAAAWSLGARRATAVRRATAAVTLIAAAVAVWGVRIDRDPLATLGRSHPFVAAYHEYTHQFPHDQNTLVVLFEAGAPEAAIRAKDAVERGLRGQRWAEQVEDPDSGFFARNGLLYLSPDDLQQMTDQLARAQPFLGRLSEDMSLRGFLGLLRMAIQMSGRGMDFDLRPVLRQIDTAAGAAMEGRSRPMSWQKMIGTTGGEADPPPMLIIRPRLDPRAMIPGLAPMRSLRQVIAEAKLEPGVRAVVTGDVALETEEATTGARDAAIGVAVGGLLLVLVLRAVMGSAGMVIGSVIGLGVTVVVTAAVMAGLGPVSETALLFPLLLVPLAAGPSAGLATAYRWELRGEKDAGRALVNAGRRGAAWAVTLGLIEAIGAGAMAVSSQRGMFELGVLVGTGCVVNGVVSGFFLPAFWSGARVPDMLEKPRRSRGGAAVRWAAMAAAVIGAAGATSVRFDGDPMRVRDPHGESVRGFRLLMRQSPLNPLSVSVLVPGEVSAEVVEEQLKEMGLNAEVVSLCDFVPERQEMKLSMIDGMSLVLGPELRARVGPPSDAERRKAVTDFTTALAGYVKGHGSGGEAGALLVRMRAVERASGGPGGGARLRLFERNLLEYLPVTLGRLRTALEAGRVEEDRLPAEVVEPWRSRNGVMRVAVFPKDRTGEPGKLAGVVDAVRRFWPRATDGAALYVDAARVTRESLVWSVIVAGAGLVAGTMLMVGAGGWRSLARVAGAAAVGGGVVGMSGMGVNMVSAMAVAPVMGAMTGLCAAAWGVGEAERAWSRRAAGMAALAGAAAAAGLMLAHGRGLQSVGVMLVMGFAAAGLAAAMGSRISGRGRSA